MFPLQRQYSCHDEDHSDRQYYGAKLKLRRFDSLEYQPSSPTQTDPEIEPCVEVRKVSYHYNSANPVLTNINLTVPKGKIYALLGASGCGKTTLLRIMLGTYKPLSGTIRVFGKQPGTPESNIPGAGVGYMPQDLALFDLLSIEENLVYYGSLYGLSRKTIKKDVKRFIELLNLPEKKRVVSQLSGGQKRRVSLAVSMIHQPPLLILDEPTVGVDSLLRQKIWNYLEELCENFSTTVLITTHYTEEAINSYRVGFIDTGEMLAEDNPKKLLNRFECTSLEEVFLELCLEKAEFLAAQQAKSQSLQQSSPPQTPSSSSSAAHTASPQFASSNATKRNIPKIILEEENEESPEKDVGTSGGGGGGGGGTKPDSNNNNEHVRIDLNRSKSVPAPASNSQYKINRKQTKPRDEINIGEHRKNRTVEDQKKEKDKSEIDHGLRNRIRMSFVRLRALMTKNYILFKRNPNSVILMNVIPILQIVLFLVSFVRNPHGIPVAVVNEEHNRSNNSLSKLFIEQIDQITLDLHYYNDLDEAIDAIHKNEARLALRFPSNFSKYFKRRFMKPERVTEKVVKHSNIELYPDTSNTVFYLYSYQAILNAFEQYVKLVGDMLGYNPSFFGSPVETQEPIYGTMEVKYFEFITPGMLICVVHGISMLIGSFTVVRERVEGHMERGFVAGITGEELLLSYILFFAFPVFTQVILILFTTFFVFESTCVGSLWYVFIISFAAGFQGVCMGIILSIVCMSQVASLMLVFSIEMPLIFSCGCLWPIISLPKWAYRLVLWNPMTLTIISVQNIIFRGWSLLHWEVFKGLAYSMGMTTLVLMFGVILFRFYR